MMMIDINKNLAATAAASALRDNFGRLSTSIQRLSSGLRVNSAADDAAGLAIRELIRADVAALNQGVRNANDAISMIQVADGALGIIDEKLIRMKELAEQAATGTYDSTQRLMIDSEFQVMASEIDRIARATDFNGIKLLDGSLSGAHDGNGLNSTGKMKIHFGAANDSAEDYYYVEIGDCTLAGLGLRTPLNDNTIAIPQPPATTPPTTQPEPSNKNIMQMPVLNDMDLNSWGSTTWRPIFGGRQFTIQNFFHNQGEWYTPLGEDPRDDITQNFIFTIPKGTKNIVINSWGCTRGATYGDQDLQLFTKSGTHLAGTPLDDFVYSFPGPGPDSLGNTIDEQSDRLGFTSADYNGAYLNGGPAQYDSTGKTLQYSKYNDMIIGYSGDPDRHDAIPNNGALETWKDCEVLTIDEAKEDLVVWMVGAAGAAIKAYWDLPDDPAMQYPPLVSNPPIQPDTPDPDTPSPVAPQGTILSIKTQDEAQQALGRIDDAIVAKDKIRAHLGALQNRLENTVTNFTIQAENLQAAEARISDANIGAEMMIFVRNQILTQSSVAMLSQANSWHYMMMSLIEGG